MPLINIGNRNTANTQSPNPAPVDNSTPTAPTAIPTATSSLPPLPNKELPKWQEAPAVSPVDPVAINEIEIKPTQTQQIVQTKQGLNDLSNQINNIANTLETPKTPIAESNITDIVSQVKQAVGNNEEVAPVPPPVVSNTVEFSKPMSDSSSASNITMQNPVEVSGNAISREIKPLSNTTTVTPKVTDPSKNLDEKLNRMNNLTELEPLVNKVELESDNGTAGHSVDSFLREAMKLGASDVHISVGYRVMVRINGELSILESPLVTEQLSTQYCEHLLKNRTVKLKDLYEYDMTYNLGNRRFRVNIFKENGTYSIAARVISESIPTMEELDLPPLMKEFANYPNGLVLVTGPTGSGKSTTIASIINLINITTSKHIITLEDPIEYVFPKSLSIVDQREFGQDFTTWSNALKAILRQDPNIVLVGEMRDLDTVESALRIAETGHLVFATLHTNSAAQTIDRIIDMFSAEKQEQVKVQLASVLQAVISQRLVKTLNNSRVAAMEILIGTPAVRNTIRESKGVQLDNIIQTGADLGMISMEKSLVKLVKMGKVSLEVARTIANRPNDFDILLQRG